MKLYFNENFELVKEEETDAHKGSNNYDKLYVYLIRSKYNEIVTTNVSLYPTYACELPDQRITPEIATWEIPVADYTDENNNVYVGWGCTILDRALSVEGSVQLTISFKSVKTITTTTTNDDEEVTSTKKITTIIRSCKSVLLVHDTIISGEDAYFVDTTNANETLKSFKQIVEKSNEQYANKLNVDGSNHANEVTLGKVKANKLYFEKNGDYLDVENELSKCAKVYEPQQIIVANQVYSNVSKTEKLRLNMADHVDSIYADIIYDDDDANKFKYGDGGYFLTDYHYGIINTALGNKADVGVSYTKSETYSKTEVNNALGNKADISALDSRNYKNITLSQMKNGDVNAVPNRKYVDDEINTAMANHIKSASVSVNTTTGTYTMHFKDDSGNELFTCNWDTPDEYIIDSTKSPLVTSTYDDEGKLVSQTTTIYLYGGTSFTIDTTSLALASGSISSDDVKLVIENGTIKATLSERLTDMITAEATRVSNENIRIANETAREAYLNNFKELYEESFKAGGFKLTANADGTATLEIKEA